MTVVDAHAHVFAAVSDRFPRDVHDDFFPADAEAPVEALLAELDAAGVERAVLVALTHLDEYVADCVARLPGRFAAIGVDGPGDVDAYRRRREAGLQGLRLFALEDAFPLLEELARQGDKLWFYGGRGQMELLGQALARLPGLTVVLNHLGFWPAAFRADDHGRPRFESAYGDENLEAVCALARFPRVHVLLTGMYAFAAGPPPYDDLRPVTAALLEAYGPRRLLLGSDWPWIGREPGYSETLAAVDAHLAGLTGDELARVRGGNALELFW
jgi:predicted TIM-barrel fold metal-dependent hydrolase